jgi:hypothetical protein
LMATSRHKKTKSLVLRLFFFALILEGSVNDMLQKKTRMIAETGFANVLQLSFMVGELKYGIDKKSKFPRLLPVKIRNS